MRRSIPILLTAILLLSLCACGLQEDTEDFYYLRSEFLPGTPDGVIAPETRAVTGERGLNYSLRLYLEGPSSEQYRSPFPEGLYLLSTKRDGELLQVFLSSEFSTLEDIDLTLACTCLARTCFGLTDANQIQIITSSTEGEVSITLTKNSFTFVDHASEPVSTK